MVCFYFFSISHVDTLLDKICVEIRSTEGFYVVVESIVHKIRIFVIPPIDHNQGFFFLKVTRE